jgi:hypothetical protein
MMATKSEILYPICGSPMEADLQATDSSIRPPKTEISEPFSVAANDLTETNLSLGRYHHL